MVYHLALAVEELMSSLGNVRCLRNWLQLRLSQLLFEKINEKTSSAKLSKVTLLSPPFQETPPCNFFLIKNYHKILYFIDNYFLLVSCYKASMCFAYDVSLYLISLEI